ncbi:hypothetical protein M422DRAFT_257519 [Sphaerobolus stellatus SS14]|uniref:Amino acid permease/ SLC12A domain-containing protein n=1 Tax=Sphaerobolus stellatus (strain SS14) TaxID=990650 RepID=A0A0C9VNN7_SPHS4|nr:hypothetical protein M422DRAFT_257519 [Sphaerobolus stellatus SS14]
MHRLATTGQVPRIFARTNKYGTPWVSLILSTPLGLLTYMGVSALMNKVFNWFRKGLKGQSLTTDILPYTSCLQPYAVWWSLIWVILIIFFTDWIFLLKSNWDHSSFITNYLLLPIFVIFGYKWWYKTKILPLEGMDLVAFANTKT